VEALAVLPALILAALTCWQLVLAGHTLWLCAGAARAAARAEVVGLSPGRAARSVLPNSLERGSSVERIEGGGVRVQVLLPTPLPFWPGPVRIGAVSSLGSER
jgi:hypothetical protein